MWLSSSQWFNTSCRCFSLGMGNTCRRKRFVSLTAALQESSRSSWVKKKKQPHLLADEVEGVDVRSSTQQPLIEDDNKHHPGTRQELVTHCEQQQDCIHHLRRTNRRGRELTRCSHRLQYVLMTRVFPADSCFNLLILTCSTDRIHSFLILTQHREERDTNTPTWYSIWYLGAPQ